MAALAIRRVCIILDADLETWLVDGYYVGDICARFARRSSYVTRF